MTWIKICGTTNLSDALMSVEAGADALGFVFAESLRRVTPDTVAEITPHLPAHVEKVGVFVSETPEQIRDIAKQCGLTAVQLNRHVAVPDLGDVGVIPVVHMSEIEEFDDFGGFGFEVDAPLQAILLDSGSKAKGGGTGTPFDWKSAHTQDFTKTIGSYLPIIVAGGLTPENVSEAIRLFQPFGVDVVSGVEREKGKKDPDKVRAFIAAARESENGWSAGRMAKNRRELKEDVNRAKAMRDRDSK